MLNIIVIVSYCFYKCKINRNILNPTGTYMV